MRKLITILIISVIISCAWSCDNNDTESTQAEATQETVMGGQSAVKDDESAKDVVKVAVGSKDHTTLVAAVKQAGLVDVLSNAGPFTVFAPTNSAFEKVPKETLDNLMKDENKEQLKDILEYHVYVGGLNAAYMTDGQTLNQVNGGNVTITKKEGVLQVNGVNIIATVPASNGIVYVIDGVLLPPKK